MFMFVFMCAHIFLRVYGIFGVWCFAIALQGRGEAHKATSACAEGRRGGTRLSCEAYAASLGLKNNHY